MVDKFLCMNTHAAGTKDKTRGQQALLKKKGSKEEVGCQPTTGGKQSRKTAVEEERTGKPK